MKYRQSTLTGLITRCTKYKEADLIFTLISEEQGLTKFIARGAKKPKSKFSGHIESLNYVNIYYKPSKGINSITQVESINSFLDLKKTYDLVIKAQYLMELSEVLSMENEKNPFLMKALLGTLAQLSNSKIPDLHIGIFEFEVLNYQGFGMNVFKCLNCRDPLLKLSHFFSSTLGGFLCNKCLSENIDNGELIKVSIQEQVILRNIARKNYRALIENTVSDNDISSIRALLQKSIKDIMDVQLKTSKFQNN